MYISFPSSSLLVKVYPSLCSRNHNRLKERIFFSRKQIIFLLFHSKVKQEESVTFLFFVSFRLQWRLVCLNLSPQLFHSCDFCAVFGKAWFLPFSNSREWHSNLFVTDGENFLWCFSVPWLLCVIHSFFLLSYYHSSRNKAKRKKKSFEWK